MLDQFFNIVSSSTVILPFIPLLNFYYEKDYIYLKVLAALLLTDFLSELTKKYIFYDNVRPEGAKDCNICNNNGDQSNKPGMPSSHVGFTTFFMFCYLYFNLTNWKISYINYLLPFYLFLIASSRYYKRCHSIEQIGGGFIFGSLMFYIFYYSFIN